MRTTARPLLTRNATDFETGPAPQGASFANQALTTIAQPIKNAAKKLCQEKDLAQIGSKPAAFAPLTASSGRA
jgi:hypothetical protein